MWTGHSRLRDGDTELGSMVADHWLLTMTTATARTNNSLDSMADDVGLENN